MPLERTKVLYRLDLCKYLIGAMLAWADVGSDIATCILYYQASRYKRFGFCVSFSLAPSIFMTIAHLVQHLQPDGVVQVCKHLVYYAVLGSGTIKLKLFTLCLKNSREVCSRQGYLVTKEDDKNAIRSNVVYGFVQSLLEDIPQMIIQVYTITDQETPIHFIQFVSITISFISLVCTLASFENRSLPGPQNAYYLIIITYNAFLVLARMITIVAFIIAYSWLTAVVLGVHEITCILLYYFMNRKRFTDTDVWWVAILLLPCYVFIYLGFKVKEIQLRTFELKITRSLLSSSVYYGIFAAENIMMITLYYSKSAVREHYSSGATAAVIMLTLVGVFLNLIFTNLYFREYHHTRHVISHQGARRSSRYDRNSRVRFSRSVRVVPHPTDQDQTVTEVVQS